MGMSMELIRFFEQWSLAFEIIFFITTFGGIMLIAFIIYSNRKEIEPSSNDKQNNNINKGDTP